MEMVEQVAHMARIDEKVDNLKVRFDKHEQKQNGSLERLENKIDKFTWWLIGLMGGVIASFLLLLVNLFTREVG